MSELAYPETFDDIDAAWLGAVLQPRHPGVRVAAVEVLERHEVTNSHARLAVRYDGDATAPPTLFCKLPPNDARRASILATGMGQKEARFYDELAHLLPFRVPATHAARQDADHFVLLLEDLVATGCRVSDGTWGIAPDGAARALEDLAVLHVRYEDPARRAAEVPWSQVPGPGGSYGTTMLQYGLDHHRDRLTDAFADIARLYIDDTPRLHALWQTGPITVIHGDPHIGNLFVDGDRVGFLDWGIMNTSSPMRDIGYFLTMAMDPDDRRAHERDLLRHYLDVRDALGGSPMRWDDVWLQHRLHAAYTVPACCQVVTFPENASARRRVFADAFLARAQAAIDDLDARGAIREVADW